MAFVEDVAPFLRDFGTDAVLNGAPVSGIFDNEYVEAFGMASRQPMFTLPTAQAGSVTQSSVLVVEGVSYRVTRAEPDGTGVTVLMLERS